MARWKPAGRWESTFLPRKTICWVRAGGGVATPEGLCGRLSTPQTCAALSGAALNGWPSLAPASPDPSTCAVRTEWELPASKEWPPAYKAGLFEAEVNGLGPNGSLWNEIPLGLNGDASCYMETGRRSQRCSKTAVVADNHQFLTVAKTAYILVRCSVRVLTATRLLCAGLACTHCCNAALTRASRTLPRMCVCEGSANYRAAEAHQLHSLQSGRRYRLPGSDAQVSIHAAPHGCAGGRPAVGGDEPLRPAGLSCMPRPVST